MPSNNKLIKEMTSIIIADGLLLTHPAPHQRTRGGHGGIDCTLISQSP